MEAEGDSVIVVVAVLSEVDVVVTVVVTVVCLAIEALRPCPDSVLLPHD